MYIGTRQPGFHEDFNIVELLSGNLYDTSRPETVHPSTFYSPSTTKNAHHLLDYLFLLFSVTVKNNFSTSTIETLAGEGCMNVSYGNSALLYWSEIFVGLSICSVFRPMGAAPETDRVPMERKQVSTGPLCNDISPTDLIINYMLQLLML
ncbi:MAG: hypothetical protein H6577_25630 [Lewinellaceae bacterium]|nr:hypothetical protein [Saprospiraceae bacterium]MCB9341518.1 hypothetical protein [Lewinellaceae bacterium]